MTQYVEKLGTSRDRADRPRRPVRRGDDDGPAQQRGRSRRRWTSTSPTRCERGAEALTGGERAAGVPDRPVLGADGAGRRPSRRPSVATEETFGPIAPVVEIESLEQAIEPGQRVPLRPAVGDLHRPICTTACASPTRSTPAGSTSTSPRNYWESHLPFGGRAGTDSGIGKVGGDHVMQSFTELQTIVISPDARRS